jgi:hypothetical protein
MVVVSGVDVDCRVTRARLLPPNVMIELTN